MKDKLNCKCGGILSCTVGDTVQNGVYRWHLSSYCYQCGNATEVDGCGIEDIPGVVQQAIIEKCGEWEILAKDKIPSISYLLKRILRNFDSDVVVKNAPTVYRGTKNQVLWVKKQLLQKGISESAIEIKESNNYTPPAKP